MTVHPQNVALIVMDKESHSDVVISRVVGSIALPVDCVDRVRHIGGFGRIMNLVQFEWLLIGVGGW